MANYVTYTTTVKLNTKEAQNQLEELKRKVEDLKQKRDAALCAPAGRADLRRYALLAAMMLDVAG